MANSVAQLLTTIQCLPGQVPTLIQSRQQAIEYATHAIDGRSDLKLENTFVLFVDGSMVPGSEESGAAVVFRKDTVNLQFEDYGFHIQGLNNIMLVELLAIKFALDLALYKALQRPARMALIFSDSKFAINKIRDLQPTNPAEYEILLYIVQRVNMLICIGVVPQIHWVKAHVGVIGNERADIVAKLVRMMADTAPPKCILTLTKYYFGTVLQIWDELWRTRDEKGGKGG
jgi:ribonuclease HI